ncbi:NADP-dependent oxidoreductase [Actinoplanes sp. HUAS TT8]|uniref:NADP-dependent oxidoreductase n=1 Tax=Actinoplanes sp. HUAS TT8 TaxID=3447453 RepID=UPI003F526210
MFAAQYAEFGGPHVLHVTDAAAPQPLQDQIRVRVRAAGISPADAALRSGRTPMSARLALPHIPGVDAAGTIDAIGPGVTGVAVGEDVFGSVDLARLGGASAEFAVLRSWAGKPPGLPWEQAGAAGTGVETATRALDLLGLRPGMTLLVDGAAGGVGSIAVQLAVARGARVIGTARPANHDFLRELGAEPVTYGPGLPARVTAADRALDVAGAGSLPELISLTGDPSAVLTLADFTAATHGVRLTMGELAGEPHGRHGLRTAAELFTQGRFRVPVEATFALSDIVAAHTAIESGGPRRGKLVLTL